MSARYVIRGVLGIVLAAAAVVIASATIYHLVRTGSCASGGPYVSARPCPEGTGLRIVALIGSIFVLCPIAVFVFASRAKGIQGVPAMSGLIGLLWSLGWLCMGLAAWKAGHGAAKPASGGEGSTAVAITFWGIGGLSLLAVLAGLAGAVSSARSRAVAATSGGGMAQVPPPAPRPAPVPLRPASGRPPAGMASLASTLGKVAESRSEVDDVARRLKQLDELRALGAVTSEEYDAKRRQILGEI